MSSLLKTPTKPIQQNLPTDVLTEIKNNMNTILDLIKKYRFAPAKTDKNREIYIETLSTLEHINKIIQYRANPDIGNRLITPHKMIPNRIRQRIDEFAVGDKKSNSGFFYIYTVGFNHPNLVSRHNAYNSLTDAVTKPEIKKIINDDGDEYEEHIFPDWQWPKEVVENIPIRNHTFYHWGYHGKHSNIVWGAGSPWLPEHFIKIWEYGTIPKEAAKQINIQHRGKRWKDVYNSVLWYGDYEYNKKNNTWYPPKAWYDKFYEVFEIRHIRKLGSSYQNPWKREKGYNELSNMISGKGTSKAFHSMRAFKVSWDEDTLKKNDKKNLEKLTGFDVEHSYHKDLFDIGAMLNRWTEKSYVEMKANNWDPSYLTFNSHFEYVFNLNYAEVQRLMNKTTEGWFLFQQQNEKEKGGFQNALDKNGKLKFKYKIESLIWTQQNKRNNAEIYQFNYDLGERLETEDRKLDQTFNRANEDLTSILSRNIKKRKRFLELLTKELTNLKF